MKSARENIFFAFFRLKTANNSIRFSIYLIAQLFTNTKNE